MHTSIIPVLGGSDRKIKSSSSLGYIVKPCLENTVGWGVEREKLRNREVGYVA
jgi:hypothetical protein